MDLIMTYKILNGAVLVDKEYFFTMNTSYSTRSNGYKIYKKFNRAALQQFTFSQRRINNWNSLLHEIVTSPNVLSFKTNLDLLFCIVNIFPLYDLLRLVL